MNLNLFCVFFLILLLPQCKKDSNYKKTTIKGKIIEKVSQNPIKSIYTELYKQYDCGSHQSDKIAEIYSDFNGEFSYEAIHKRCILESYLLLIYVTDKYFVNYGSTKNLYINRSEIYSTDIIIRNITLDEAGHINLRIMNSTPIDSEDFIGNFIISPANTVPSNLFSYLEFNGTSIDTSITNIKVLGNSFIQIKYTTLKNKILTQFFDSVFVNNFTTVDCSINY